MMAVILRRGHAERMMKVAAVSREMRDVAKARGAGAVLRRRATLVVWAEREAGEETVTAIASAAAAAVAGAGVDEGVALPAPWTMMVIAEAAAAPIANTATTVPMIRSLGIDGIAMAAVTTIMVVATVAATGAIGRETPAVVVGATSTILTLTLLEAKVGVGVGGAQVGQRMLVGRAESGGSEVDGGSERSSPGKQPRVVAEGQDQASKPEHRAMGWICAPCFSESQGREKAAWRVQQRNKSVCRESRPART
jgi:hypothetical protein